MGLIGYSLYAIMRDDILELTKQSCYNKKNKQTNKEVEIWDQSPNKGQTLDTGVNS